MVLGLPPRYNKTKKAEIKRFDEVPDKKGFFLSLFIFIFLTFYLLEVFIQSKEEPETISSKSSKQIGKYVSTFLIYHFTMFSAYLRFL